MNACAALADEMNLAQKIVQKLATNTGARLTVAAVLIERSLALGLRCPFWLKQLAVLSNFDGTLGCEAYVAERRPLGDPVLEFQLGELRLQALMTKVIGFLGDLAHRSHELGALFDEDVRRSTGLNLLG